MVLFVLASDDEDWSKRMFSSEPDVVFTSSAKTKYSMNQPETFDLAVMSQCNHSILRNVIVLFIIIIIIIFA
jgi:hypothetical protein